MGIITGAKDILWAQTAHLPSSFYFCCTKPTSFRPCMFNFLLTTFNFTSVVLDSRRVYFIKGLVFKCILLCKYFYAAHTGQTLYSSSTIQLYIQQVKENHKKAISCLYHKPFFFFFIRGDVTKKNHFMILKGICFSYVAIMKTWSLIYIIRCTEMFFLFCFKSQKQLKCFTTLHQISCFQSVFNQIV